MSKRFGCFCGLLVAMFLSSFVVSQLPAGEGAADPPQATKKAKAKAKKAQANKPAAPAEVNFATMKAELNLQDPQAQKIEALWQARDKALSEWDTSPRGQQLAKLREQLGAATTDRATLAAQVSSSEAQRRDIEQTHDAKILRTLTAEQRAKWLGFLLNRDLVKVLTAKGVQLSAEQAQQVRALCDRAAKSLPDAPDSSTMARMRGMLAREIFAKILTDKQRKALDPDYKPDRKNTRNNNRNRDRKLGVGGMGA